MLDGHISSYCNKDTRDLFMLCIILVCQLYCVVFIIVVQLILLLFNFHSGFVRLLFDYCFPFNSFAFIVQCSLLEKKIFNSDPGLHSRHFDSAVLFYKKYHHHL
jgi:hypothetical protein